MPTPNFDDPHHLRGEFRVKLTDGHEASVDIEGRDGLTIMLHTSTAKQIYSFVDLLQRARANALPAWVQQVPQIMARIEAVFEKERAGGKDPFFHVGISGDEVFHEDLRRGVRHARTLKDLREALAHGQKLPAVYDTPAIRAALGLE